MHNCWRCMVIDHLWGGWRCTSALTWSPMSIWCRVAHRRFWGHPPGGLSLGSSGFGQSEPGSHVYGCRTDNKVCPGCSRMWSLKRWYSYYAYQLMKEQEAAGIEDDW